MSAGKPTLPREVRMRVKALRIARDRWMDARREVNRRAELYVDVQSAMDARRAAKACVLAAVDSLLLVITPEMEGDE